LLIVAQAEHFHTFLSAMLLLPVDSRLAQSANVWWDVEHMAKARYFEAKVRVADNGYTVSFKDH
jgi:hypothetical protein